MKGFVYRLLPPRPGFMGGMAEDLTEVEAMPDNDPAIRSGHGLRAEIAPMVRLVTPGRSYDGR